MIILRPVAAGFGRLLPSIAAWVVVAGAALALN